MNVDQTYIKLSIEYDGTDFSGWQVQPGQRTVQGEVERALAEIAGQTIRIVGAGRTDAGVHALGMVASFPYSGHLPLNAFKKGLNTHLPLDIYIHDAVTINGYFDARRHATERAYRYVLSRRPTAVARQYSWCPRQELDIAAMQNAANFLIGEHDFKSFSKEDDSVDDYTSNVFHVQWVDNGNLVTFDIRAIRFFHHMIRILMGTLLRVGAGKLSPDEFKSILEARDASLAGPTIPPTGLFLVHVHYNR